LISFTIKDLWLGITDKKDKKILYKIYDDICSNIEGYDKINNKNTFDNLDPIVDINYLFNITDTKYFIHPFYDYQTIIFNNNKHKNIIIEDTKYINIDVNELIKYKLIFIKSPTGSGKTVNLLKIIDTLNIHNIISITSRVNLAGEHTKTLNLKFYKDLKYNDFHYCYKLVIQLESICKCNYRLFKNGVVILDEINSLLSHLRSPTFNNKRSDCYKYLIQIIKNARYVISLDADLSDWNIEFIKAVKNDNYIVYRNINKNKINIPVEFFISDQVMIDIMANSIKNNKYFVACFDSLSKMNLIINYLKQFKTYNNDARSNDWLIYSSEINYELIDTSTWCDKFIFFTPTIIYGVDFNYKPVDVFCFIHKFHLNPLQAYQMISRARKMDKVHIYTHTKLFNLKYKSVDDVIYEFKLFKNNFSSIVDNLDYETINEEAYQIMYFNFKFMDSILKTNINEYLIDIMTNLGYNITHNNVIIGNKYNKETINKDIIKERIVNLLNLDGNTLTEFEKNLASSDKKLEQHFNFRIFYYKTFEYKLESSINKNLFTETVKNKYTKIKIIDKLMNILNIHSINNFNKDLTKLFETDVKCSWLDENINTITKIFVIRGKKYNNTGLTGPRGFNFVKDALNIILYINY
jgi:hypothetical protein